MTTIKLKKIIADRRGSILMITVMILSITLIIALAAADLSLSQYQVAKSQEKSVIAYFAAEAGAENAMYNSRVSAQTSASSTNCCDPNLSARVLPCFIPTTSQDNGSTFCVDYVASSTPNVVMYNSTGDFGEVKRSIELDTQ